jgi:ATP phosphoribosyltransferase regulatory subunit HisZ
MKRLICLMLAIIIIGCQQESIELSKIELDKASLKRVLEANADYQRLPKAFDNFKLEAIDQLSKMTQEELNNLSNIFSKYSGTEILNASDAVKTLVKKCMPEDEYICYNKKLPLTLKSIIYLNKLI